MLYALHFLHHYDIIHVVDNSVCGGKMKNLIIGLLLTFFAVLPADAKTMIVRVPVLNVRSCPSTDCKILKKIHKDDRVKIVSVSNNWAQIQLDNDKKAYVLHKSLRKSYFFLWYYAAGFLLLFIMIKRAEIKCPSCRKWGALHEIGRECIDKQKSNITKTATTRYKNYTRRREYIVPATLYVYKVKYKCKFCGYTVTKTEQEKKEN